MNDGICFQEGNYSMTGTISLGIHSEEFLSKINLQKKTHRFRVYFHKLQNESLNIYRKNTNELHIYIYHNMKKQYNRS